MQDPRFMLEAEMGLTDIYFNKLLTLASFGGC
jgi:hypothetical protein